MCVVWHAEMGQTPLVRPICAVALALTGPNTSGKRNGKVDQLKLSRFVYFKSGLC
jgi:hypothetical protein